ITREPVVAGQFYPGNAEQLRAELNKLFTNASKRITQKDVLAIISPHAGYVFSGEVAASSFNQLDYNKKYKTIFIIGSSHRTIFDGASIYNKGHFKTPLGIVHVDIGLANYLIGQHRCFNNRTDAHIYEHSLEVQIPFLQYRLKNDFTIVPIVIATQNRETCRKIAAALKPYFTSDNLFVISTDFSHYPAYENANKIDKLTAEAIISNRPQELLNTIDANELKGIDNLATSLCGWSSVLTLMHMTEKMEGIKYIPVEYKNSGDAKGYGDKTRVVGYYSIAIVKEDDANTADKTGELRYSLQDKKTLLSLARKTIEDYILKGTDFKPETDGYSTALLKPSGAFVTLHHKGNLRGCIGRFDATLPLYQVVQEMAISAATRDSRFSPVSPSELAEIDIEISVLTPLQKINSIEEITLGKHGIYIKKDYRSGTFLPQVANDTKWTLEEFLGHCARDKAGIGWDGWKEAELFTYEAIIFGEKNLGE
ncbi:MAG: AmmeMemoRadiSam system protein B, partial [Bacteroidales bacterium]|nr:AmmeMemoRadiSam system protein B [Bacteroidales bacterium]